MKFRLVEKIKERLVSLSIGFFIKGCLSPIITIFFFNLSYTDSFNNLLKVDNIGSVGDFLSGSTTPFFTMAAFFVLIKSYFLQKEELKAAREEMQASAKALEAQKQIMKNEAQVNADKNTLDIFFMLFNNWRELANKEIFNVYYQVVVDRNMIDKNVIANYIFDGIPSSKEKVNVSEYGKHLKIFLKEEDINLYGNFVSLPSIGHYGEREYGFIIENLQINSVPLVQNFNNLVLFIKNNNESRVNKTIMMNTIISSITWGEKFVFNMIVSDYILGNIAENEIWRTELKNNLAYLKLEMENYDGAAERFARKLSDVIAQQHK